uniref:Uncharacterized protein n=1 Tax=Dromaius novaehollandiae TaxID=8790 RepID=A0A8C4K3V9_DRONO
MGTCMHEEKAAILIDRRINKTLREEKRRDQQELKLLLLGESPWGKVASVTLGFPVFSVPSTVQFSLAYLCCGVWEI